MARVIASHLPATRWDRGAMYLSPSSFSLVEIVKILAQWNISVKLVSNTRLMPNILTRG